MPIDPVCGMEVSEETEFKVEYGGKTYYFCSPHCKAQFEANPEKFISGEMHSHVHEHKMHGHKKHHGCCH
ncbi:YHS domain-containing protein [Thermococcus sp. M39]|uniref:YHS domain-containing protein n=1 Tax=unclassified Thermococcus TaxID=2627626 RepID=UPI0014393862|nr:MULTISPECIES: YHS domain-containing protein [unclassified Thermococcus]NJE09012.1 YHS domain-containing protein [Thermococcus sp. M39]NJE13323.1 YHS domain-containing protein [Thermococcus sp. LS2]